MPPVNSVSGLLNNYDFLKRKARIPFSRNGISFLEPYSLGFSTTEAHDDIRSRWIWTDSSQTDSAKKKKKDDTFLAKGNILKRGKWTSGKKNLTTYCQVYFRIVLHRDLAESLNHD